MDRSKELPNGFYDYAGVEAEKRRIVTDDFREVGKLYGFDWADPSPVGYEETYLSFGSAAIDRGYQFEDPGGRKLMLCADSLATALRIHRKVTEANAGKTSRIMGEFPVFRNRRKKYRNWSHLSVSMFNETDNFQSNMVLVNFFNDFAKPYYPEMKYDIYFYDVFEQVFKKEGISKDQGWEALYNVNKGNTKGDAEAVVMDIFNTCGQSDNWRFQFHYLEKKYPYLKELLNNHKKYLNILEKKGLDYSVKWEDGKAIEYSSGTCFLVYDKSSGKRIADGGSYEASANKMDKNIKNCFSLACSLHDFTEKVDLNEKDFNKHYFLKKDCSDDFFTDSCQYVRDVMRIPVIEIDASKKKLNEVLCGLPKEAKYSVIGRNEEDLGAIFVDGQKFSIKDKESLNNNNQASNNNDICTRMFKDKYGRG